MERAMTTKEASEPSLESEIAPPTNPAASAASAAQPHAAQAAALPVDSDTTTDEGYAPGAVIEEYNAAVSATIADDNTASVASTGGDNAAAPARIGEDNVALSTAIHADAIIDEETPAEIDAANTESTASVEEDTTVSSYTQNNMSTARIDDANAQSAVSTTTAAIGEDNTASQARDGNVAIPTNIEENNDSIGALAPNGGDNTAINRGARNPDSANTSHNSPSSLNRRRPAGEIFIVFFYLKEIT